jgi:signal peptidase II
MPRISPSLRHPRLAAALAILFAALADIAIKRVVLAHAWDGIVLVPGFLDVHYAMNHGVSFNLFWQSTTLGATLLGLLLLGVTLFFAVLAFRTPKPLVAAGFGLIVGGALGNMADRFIHGAVFDFLVVRLGSTPLFVCNPADVFISLGVILLGWDMLFEKSESKLPAGRA